MSQLKICRICLRTEAKMYKMNMYSLQLYYQEVLAFKVDDTDRLPQYFCYECATLLHKFHNFKEKCYMGQKILKDMDMEGRITYEAIYMVDRKEFKLISSLDMIQHAKVGTIFTMVDNNFIQKNGKRDKKVIHQEEAAIKENAKKKELDIEHVSVDQERAICIIDMIKTEKTEIPLPLEEESTMDYKDTDTHDNNMIIHDRDTHDNNMIIHDHDTHDNDVHDNDVHDHDTHDDDIHDHDTHGNDVHDHDTHDNDIHGHDTHDNDVHDDNDHDICTEDSIIKSTASRNPTDVFIVVDKNKDVTVKKLKARRLKQPICDSVTKSKKKYKIAWKFLQVLNSGNWKKTTMSEEEMLQNFRVKSQDEKYITAEYKCTDCFMFFSNNEIFTRHRQKWHTELNNPFECRICKRRYKHNHQVTKHMKYHYNKFECQRCNLVSPLESTVMIHDDYHNGGTKRCKICNEEFQHQSTYYSHVRTAHRSKYLCNLCGRSFVNEVGLRKHKKRTHLGATEEQLAVNKQTSDVNKDVNTYCSICDIRFETEEAYNKHVFHTSEHSNIITPERQPRKRIYRKPTECPECGKIFKTQSACSKHYENVHPNHKFIPYPDLERKAVCELCGATVLFKNLKIHLMNTHEKKNACYCNICGLKFSVQATLKRHSLVHTGEKPYKCTLCDKRFTQKGSMELHYRTFHLKEPYPKRIRKKICTTLQQDSVADLPETNK